MSDQAKGRHAELEWTENHFHPRLKQRGLPNINDGVDSKVIAFAIGAVSGICLCVLIRYAEALKHLVSNF
jgi:hypothetical protein